MPDEFTASTGVTYTKQADGTWLGSNGNTKSQSAAEALYRSAGGSDDAEVSTRVVTRNDGSQVLINSVTGEDIRVIDPAPPPKDTSKPVQNLGNNVFRDEIGTYTLEDVQQGDGSEENPYGSSRQKKYLTTSEVKALLDPESSQPSDTESGNLSARWAELQNSQAEFAARQQLEQAKFDELMRQNAIAQAQADESMVFLREKEAFAQSQDQKRLANETQAQIVNQQSTMVTLQQQRQQMELNHAITQAQMQSQADQFNASMGFNVAQANQQAQAQKRQELAQSSRDIASFSESPTDWGKLAAFEMASGPFGTEDQQIQESGGFTTDKSLQPLAQGLGARGRILAAPDNPYSFNPIQAPILPGLGASPDLSFLNNFGISQTGQSDGLVNEALTGQSEVLPREALTPQQIAQRRLDEATAMGKPTEGWTVSEEGKYVGPKIDWDKARASLRNLPKKEDGGVVQGAFIAGDSSDGKENEEVVIPDFPVQGMTTVVPKSKITPKMRKHMMKFATGGVFDSGLLAPQMDTTQARQFQQQAAQRARAGTPWQTGALPGATFASSPGTDIAVQQLIASLRGLEYGEDPNYFMRRAQQLAPAAMGERIVGRSA